jgi:hypothetical protein
LPSIEDNEMLGSLAALVKLHLPSLQCLELHEGLCKGTGTPSNTPDKYKARSVEVEGTSGFVMARSVALQRECECWWNSADGCEFRAALNAEDTTMLEALTSQLIFSLGCATLPTTTRIALLIQSVSATNSSNIPTAIPSVHILIRQ